MKALLTARVVCGLADGYSCGLVHRSRAIILLIIERQLHACFEKLVPQAFAFFLQVFTTP